MPIPGNLLTTAMAVMPHRDVDQALDAALSLDIPFWPQLPRLNYYEDMYVQASEHFPGIVLNLREQTLSFSLDKFIAEFEEALAHFEEPAYFDISHTYSAVYHRFLALDLADRPAIRGQLEGPISFGLNVLDQDRRPILFDDSVRPFLFEFMARRINVQLQRMKVLNPNAFMFVDEPGLQFLFSALSGYDALAAKQDMDDFFSMVDRPRGVHLCGNPDWDFSAQPRHGSAFAGCIHQRRDLFQLRQRHQTFPGAGRAAGLGHGSDQLRTVRAGKYRFTRKSSDHAMAGPDTQGD